MILKHKEKHMKNERIHTSLLMISIAILFIGYFLPGSYSKWATYMTLITVGLGLAFYYLKSLSIIRPLHYVSIPSMLLVSTGLILLMQDFFLGNIFIIIGTIISGTIVLWDMLHVKKAV